MVFSSPLFIFCFLPAALILSWMAYKFSTIKVMNGVILVMSMAFFAWSGVRCFLLLLIVIAVNYVLTLAMVRFDRFRRLFLVLILCIDIGHLLYYKYFSFFVNNLRSGAGLFGISLPENIKTVVLPLGISFYTFSIISYAADVFKERVGVQKNPLKLALYVLMFPKIFAGPIVRYKDIHTEIGSRTVTGEEIEEGARRFIIGFFKKVFLASAMGTIADAVFGIRGSVNFVYAWLGAICYTLQIYYDFSGYSDMAIGVARMLGFHFGENFNLPYISKSVQEFWRRWHISLSTWFRDYVYIPLGGNRKGNLRTYVNLSVVFLLTGFWHGAAWQFIVWGIYHGVFLVLERAWGKKVLERLPGVIRHIYALIVIIIGWVFFRADDLPAAAVYIRNMFTFSLEGMKRHEVILKINGLFAVCLVIAVIFSFTRGERLNRYKWWTNKTFCRLRYLFLWGISVLYLTGMSYNPFIYFKF